MSALDLFASALGAFILITVVLFPYFPNTGDSRVRVAEVKKELQQALDKINQAEMEKAATQSALSTTQAANSSLQRKIADLKHEVSTLKFPELDIVIALDISGSMFSQIGSLKRETYQLAKLLEKLAPSVALGMVTFGDREWDRSINQFPLRLMTGSSSNLDAFKLFVDEIEASQGLGSGGNPDYPEDFARAQDVAVAMNWRNQSQKKMVILVTDYPAYPEEESRAISVAGKFASQGDGRMVSIIYVNNTGDEEFFEAVASAGKGNFVTGSTSIAADILLALL